MTPVLALILGLAAANQAHAEEPIDTEVDANAADSTEDCEVPAWDVDPRPASVFGLGGGLLVPDVSMLGSVRVRLNRSTTLSPFVGWGQTRINPQTETLGTLRATLAASGGLELRQRVWHNARSDVPLLLGVYTRHQQLRSDSNPWVETAPDAEIQTTALGVRAGIAVERWIAPGVVLTGALYVPLGEHLWYKNGLQTQLPTIQERHWTTLGIPQTAVSVHVFP